MNINFNDTITLLHELSVGRVCLASGQFSHLSDFFILFPEILKWLKSENPEEKTKVKLFLHNLLNIRQSIREDTA